MLDSVKIPFRREKQEPKMHLNGLLRMPHLPRHIRDLAHIAESTILYGGDYLVCISFTLGKFFLATHLYIIDTALHFICGYSECWLFSLY